MELLGQMVVLFFTFFGGGVVSITFSLKAVLIDILTISVKVPVSPAFSLCLFETWSC